MIGIFGKLPGYGDFVRRGLPASFVQPFDEAVQDGLAAAQARLDLDFAARWVAAPAWRFWLPAGDCGDAPVAGVMLSSVDAAGRHFPLTLAALLASGDGIPPPEWYGELERAGELARRGELSADALLAQLPERVPPAIEPASRIGRWWSAATGTAHAFGRPAAAHFLELLPEPREPVEPRGEATSADGGGAPRRSEAATDAGTVRKRNEDAFVDRSDLGLWAVADGAGGHEAGDVASGAIRDALLALPAGLTGAALLTQVRQTLIDVHAALQARSEEGGTGLVSTVVVLMASGGHFACLWAGDSRAYLFRDGALVQLTHDHSVLQELVDAGMLRPEETERHPQGNVITRAVGGSEPLQLDKVAGRLEPGDVVLLCTDGLFKALSEERLVQLLGRGAGARDLVEASLAAEARDNVTVLLVHEGRE